MGLMNIKYNNEDLLFAALGGAGEIGMNCYVYYNKGKWLVVDLGIGFADESLPGVEIIVPNINFLIKNKQDIAGLVLTHAHEDHIGAVQYLWPELECPVYTTKFTSAVLKAKLADVGLENEVDITEVPENSKFSVGPFDIEFFNITHSIPEMHGLMLRTDKGNIFHTGDWKLDIDPIIGNATNEEALKKFGDEGILALVCDSTNIFNQGSSISEGELQKSLQDIICGFKNNLVIVTTFASNIARIHSIAKAAESANRRVVLIGRSLWRVYEAAKQSGYLEDLHPFLTDREAKHLKREEMLVICTGCQGEPLAATNKIANHIHPSIKAQKGDAIIFASKIIPGNEKKIFKLFNQFCKLRMEVLTEKDHFVHVSGHPARDDVARMYELLRPQIAIPMHGEAVHLHEHTKFALEHGAKQAVEVENGDVISIEENGANKIGTVISGSLAIDGNYILLPDSKLIKARRKMRDEGLVIITLLINSKRKPFSLPLVVAPGVLDEKDDSEVIDAIKEEIFNHVSKGKFRHRIEIEKYIVSTAKRIVRAEAGKYPEIIVQIEQI
ncbi:ribonuclease J [Holosporaceae bacterium 'Namur']|nr:ribonuclease J [Holosporaceae bacterium 'Namur']